MQLPIVLAGPIVRRATPEKVWVWLATSTLLDPPHLNLYEYDQASRTSKRVVGESEWYPVALSNNFWVYMLAAIPTKPLTPGDIYEYDVKLGGVKTTDIGIKPLFLPDDLRQITLKGFSRPSFVLGYQKSHEMRAIYGSCRKLHGPNLDLMKSAEQVLEKGRPQERPQYFFLGGDQIYADDVHPTFLTLTKPLRDALFSSTFEVIPGLSPQALTLSESRAKYLKPFFTSGEMDHHLLTFAEFATTYLMAWNGGLWEPLVRIQDMATRESMSAPRLLDSRLVGGAIGSKHTRKVLANIICYMIFDDHEITDDWFLNETWENNAAKHDAAIRIMTNGLSAYWAFQGWGNDPEVFVDSYRSTISTFATGGGRNTAAAWNILRKTDWSFLAPTSPKVLFLDTRTKRESSPKVIDDVGFGFKTRAITPLSPGILAQNIQSAPDVLTEPRNINAPRLLGAQTRTRLAELIDKNLRPGTPLIVIAPAPIFGFPPVEWIQSQIGKLSAPSADLESWSANPRNLLDAIELFSSTLPHPLIILSGDVHYGFEVVGRIRSENRSVPFVQFCSSALKNKVEGVQKFFFNFISKFGDKEIPFAYWDLRKQGQTDGSIAYTNVGSQAAKLFYDFYGEQSLHILASQFIKRSGRSTGKERIEDQNNLGELIVSINKVSHRHWYADGKSSVSSRGFQTWDTKEWPV